MAIAQKISNKTSKNSFLEVLRGKISLESLIDKIGTKHVYLKGTYRRIGYEFIYHRDRTGTPNIYYRLYRTFAISENLDEIAKKLEKFVLSEFVENPEESYIGKYEGRKPYMYYSVGSPGNRKAVEVIFYDDQRRVYIGIFRSQSEIRSRNILKSLEEELRRDYNTLLRLKL